MRLHLNICGQQHNGRSSTDVASPEGPTWTSVEKQPSFWCYWSSHYYYPSKAEDWEIVARAALGASDKSWILFRCHGSSIGSFVVFFLRSRVERFNCHGKKIDCSTKRMFSRNMSELRRVTLVDNHQKCLISILASKNYIYTVSLFEFLWPKTDIIML